MSCMTYNDPRFNYNAEDFTYNGGVSNCGQVTQHLRIEDIWKCLKLDTQPTNTLTNQTIWQNPVEGAYTAEEILRIVAAILAGKATGAGTNTEVFRDLNDTKDRIISNADQSGNRSNVTRDVT